MDSSIKTGRASFRRFRDAAAAMLLEAGLIFHRHAPITRNYFPARFALLFLVAARAEVACPLEKGHLSLGKSERGGRGFF